MATAAQKMIKVIAPDGSKHIVPESNRKTLEQMNRFSKPGQQYRIFPYDPNEPDAPTENVGFTNTVTKLATKNAELEAQNAALLAQLEAMKKGGVSATSKVDSIKNAESIEEVNELVGEDTSAEVMRAAANRVKELKKQGGK